jgi:predicted branched-subunit amino acid permease
MPQWAVVNGSAHAELPCAPRRCALRVAMGETAMGTLPMLSATAFATGLKAAARSVFVYVIFGTFIGYGALCHDLGFSLPWAVASTVLIWAGPAQVIVVTALGSGVPAGEAAVAVTLSGLRLLPMVAALLPLVKTPSTRFWHLLLPAHLTAVSMWVESLRIAPRLPRERRIAFCNGLGIGMVAAAVVAAILGYIMAERLPPLFGAAVLFLTPMSFTVSIARNSRELVDRFAFGFGLTLTPIFALAKVDLALLAGGVLAGTLAFAVHRVAAIVREASSEAASEPQAESEPSGEPGGGP